MVGTKMKYDGTTGELVCYAPEDEQVLKIIEPDFKKAGEISAAIQAAYKKGRMLGRLDMQFSIEKYMEILNR